MEIGKKPVFGLADFTKLLDVLHLQAKNGCVHPMRSQVLLRSIPCDVRAQSSVVSENEVFLVSKSA